jgi:hypothetical protein
VAKRKEKEDWVMKCGKEKGKGRLGDEVFSFLFTTLHHPVFLFLSLCQNLSPSLSFPFSLSHSSPNLLFPFSLPHFLTQSSFSLRKEKEDWVMKCGKEKGKRRLGEEVWQRERKKKIG